jgi:hypothetical protein
MSLDKSMKSLKYDKRLTEWNLRNNQMTKEELQKHLTELPDLSTQVAYLTLEEEGTEEGAH